MRDEVEAAAVEVDTHMATLVSLPLHMLCSLVVEEQRWETHMEPSRQQWKQQISQQGRLRL